MANACAMCGKGSDFGHLVSHAKNRTKTIRKPNLHPAKVMVDGKKVKMRLCTKCLRRADRFVKVRKEDKVEKTEKVESKVKAKVEAKAKARVIKEKAKAKAEIKAKVEEEAKVKEKEARKKKTKRKKK